MIAMVLFVDIGNTTVKWATDKELGDGVIHQTAVGEPLSTMLSTWERMNPPLEVHISSVLRNTRTAEICQWISYHWQVSPVLAETKAAEMGVTNGYSEPGRLGVDRWLALLAARSLFKTPSVVVDCGSATTLDSIDSAGRHLGGVILPGLHLFQRCLVANTDIPAFEDSGTIDYFATDTASGISSGAMLATASSVARMVEMLQKRSGEQVNCLLTGGGSQLLAQHLNVSHRLVPNLVLQGLALLAGRKD
ncbi:MAG: type III pantothenate kinase [Candidatus Thiodiazotropha sp. (ex Semelilucina semeliformis)]|nr:type III pantothenate kinase [Candidatus Thiodiazotropha sp. (ex Myrtea spinifera)]MCU7808943.1 type III pantothenate kinase [Candidatus Thiodiazotropha sp. (ex Semelilucina semeliformis)]